MQGHDVYRAAVGCLSDITLELLESEGLTTDDIDLFVYHQANARITRAVGERLGLPAGRVVDCIAEQGNTGAATLPLALSHAAANGHAAAGGPRAPRRHGRRLHLRRGPRRMGRLASRPARRTAMTRTAFTRDAIEQRITAALIEFGVEPGATRLDATWEEIDVDSLDLAELAQIIEEEYDVELRHADMQSMKTVGDAVDMIAARAV